MIESSLTELEEIVLVLEGLLIVALILTLVFIRVDQARLGPTRWFRLVMDWATSILEALMAALHIFQAQPLQRQLKERLGQPQWDAD
jgi:hypothetical protein